MPFFQTFKDQGYNRSFFKADSIAGITVGVVLIPQAIAYALLMGVPPIYGLYACLVPLVLYAIFGTSRQLSIGPVAVTAILVMSGVSQLAEPFTEKFIELVLFAGFLIGVLQIIMSVLRMGFLVNLISQPVISGFISAAAIIIIVSQLEQGLGIEIPDFKHTHQIVWYTISHFFEVNWITLTICVGSIVFINIFKQWKRSFPGALMVLVITTVVVYLFDLHNHGVAIIKDVPSGLPSFTIPEMSYETMVALMPSVLTVTFIGYVGSIGIAKSMQMKNRDHIIRPNQELFALGIAKVIGSFFQAIPSSGSYSRTAINDEAGGKTAVSSIITAVMVLFSLLFLTSYFYYIPKATLAAIIIVSVFGLVNFSEAKYLFKLRRRDFIVMLITFLGTLIFGVEKGILIGVLLSFVFLQYYSARPHIAELVNIPGTKYYRNINRFPDALQSPEYLIIRFDNQLYFGNSSYFKDTILAYISKRKPTPNFFILDNTNMHDMDSTGLHVLEDIQQYLDTLGIQLLMVGTIGPVRDFLKRSGFTDKLGVDHYYLTISDAVDYAENRTKHAPIHEAAIQFNTKRRSFLD
ncbi:SulP family inorganic anion transporter [Aquimarina muelleri]|uniref:SulP family inorganic anion transporter n=1 Tax=Aquimarina muelleri TaxID=279356 RepID=UPI0004834293|nr:solute carrier family 26 protein [Aquimarina muelleri]MCX2762041.1 solute carrier family 26 protein [Aquimarina muelleri]